MRVANLLTSRFCISFLTEKTAHCYSLQSRRFCPVHYACLFRLHPFSSLRVTVLFPPPLRKSPRSWLTTISAVVFSMSKLVSFPVATFDLVSQILLSLLFKYCDPLCFFTVRVMFPSLPIGGSQTLPWNLCCASARPCPKSLSPRQASLPN